MARAIVVNSGCANACTGDEGTARGARHGGRDGAARRVFRRGSARRVHRRDRRRAADRQDPRGAAGGVPRAGHRSGLGGGARDHDDRSVSQGGGGRGPDWRPHGPDRRDGQRLRHDRADDGDDARLHHDRRRCSAAAARPRACATRWTTASTRSPSTANARPTIRVMLLANGASGASIDEVTYRRLRPGAACGLPRAGDGHRARRRRRDQARDRHRHGRRVRGGGAPRREGHRQFAARQDGDSRRRSRTGAGSSPWPDARTSPSSCRARRS